MKKIKLGADIIAQENPPRILHMTGAIVEVNRETPRHYIFTYEKKEYMIQKKFAKEQT